MPLLRNGRPAYRSIPARRATRGTGRVNKLDYYLYSTRDKGFDEWVLDPNDVSTDGARAVVSASGMRPEEINSDWSIFSDERGEWSGDHISITCRGDGTAASSNSAAAARAPWSVAALGAPLVAAVVLRLARGGREGGRRGARWRQDRAD